MAMPTVEIHASATLQQVPVTSLRRWLRGSWALLFSHPDDFAQYDFEADRWVRHVREAFALAWVRPLAVASDGSPNGGAWIAEAGGGAVATFDQQLQDYPLGRTAPERTLQAAVQNAGSRFVMILDNSLRLQRTLLYSAPDMLPSPLELVSLLVRPLQKQQSAAD